MYICECGKEFDNPQKFNGHKQGCKVHLELKYGSIEAYYAIKNRGHAAGVEAKKKQAANHKAQREIDWISEQHTCEHCGKVMTEKFGSGRFCSKSCANGHTKSDESRIKVSETLRGYKLSDEQIRILLSPKEVKPKELYIGPELPELEKRNLTTRILSERQIKLCRKVLENSI